MEVFVDDIFIMWPEGDKKLRKFLDYLNNAHHAIKFTAKWSTEEIEFLNVRVMKGCGQLETDLFVKATDSH